MGLLPAHIRVPKCLAEQAPWASRWFSSTWSSLRGFGVLLSGGLAVGSGCQAEEAETGRGLDPQAGRCHRNSPVPTAEQRRSGDLCHPRLRWQHCNTQIRGSGSNEVPSACTDQREGSTPRVPLWSPTQSQRRFRPSF